MGIIEKMKAQAEACREYVRRQESKVNLTQAEKESVEICKGTIELLVELRSEIKKEQDIIKIALTDTLNKTYKQGQQSAVRILQEEILRNE